MALTWCVAEDAMSRAFRFGRNQDKTHSSVGTCMRNTFDGLVASIQDVIIARDLSSSK